MRTKTLLLTAAVCAAGVATSMAQVYSANVVGYVNQSLSVGFNMVCNPLDSGTNTIANVIPTPPGFSTAFKFTGGAFSAGNTFIPGVGWGDPSMTLNPGEGVFITVPTAYTNTFVGEVRQGNLTNALATGFNLVASQVPQSGGVQTVLGLTPGNFDTLFQWNAGTQQYLPGNTFIPGPGWGGGEPNIAVGEAFFFNNASGASTWVRSFTVN
jgi:hypothetical protein